MKKTLYYFSLVIISLGLIESSGISQTSENIIKKMIEAHGGKIALENVKDWIKSGSIEAYLLDQSVSLTEYKKEPNQRRTEMKIGDKIIIKSYDGKNGWWINPQTGNPEQLPKSQIKDLEKQAMGWQYFVFPEKYGISFYLKQREKIDGKDYFVLDKVTDNYRATIYVSVETYLIYKEISLGVNQLGTKVKLEQIYSDYKKVNSIMVPHTITGIQDGVKVSRWNITEIRINTGLKDSLFKLRNKTS